MIYDSYRLIWKILRAYGYLGNQEVTIAKEIFNLWRVIKNSLKILSGRMKFISSQNVFVTVIRIVKITPDAPLHISLIIMQNYLFPLPIQRKSSNILTCFYNGPHRIFWQFCCVCVLVVHVWNPWHIQVMSVTWEIQSSFQLFCPISKLPLEIPDAPYACSKFPAQTQWPLGSLHSCHLTELKWKLLGEVITPSFANLLQ